MKKLLFIAAAFALAACHGSGSTGGPPTGDGLADLTGPWFLTISCGPVAGDFYTAITQTGQSITAEMCDPSFPRGTGSWDGTGFTLVFDFGDETFSASGLASGSAIIGTCSCPGNQAGTFRLERTAVLDCANACAPAVVPKFVDVDFTELSKISEISLFRSSAGHSYNDSCETCRSMKHYFAPHAAYLENNSIQVRSPVAGQVVFIENEQHGAAAGAENKQVHIRSAIHPELTFLLFHVDLAPGVAEGNVVPAGDAVGTARLVYPDLGETAHDFDIAVQLHTPYGDRYVSWFDVMTDALFSSYAARGATSRSQFVITNSERDSDPLTCSGETFTSFGSLPAWFVLN